MSNNIINEGDMLPNFSLITSELEKISVKDFFESKSIIFLFPKSNTPSCTKEVQEFQKRFKEFNKIGFKIFGLSNDTAQQQEKFRVKNQVQFSFISDENCILISQLNSWVKKNMYGKEYMGTERSTFIVINGLIEKIYRKVKVNNHVEEVLNFVSKS